MREHFPILHSLIRPRWGKGMPPLLPGSHPTDFFRSVGGTIPISGVVRGNRRTPNSHRINVQSLIGKTLKKPFLINGCNRKNDYFPYFYLLEQNRSVVDLWWFFRHWRSTKSSFPFHDTHRDIIRQKTKRPPQSFRFHQ